jgi:hypothetical protein
LEKIDRRKLLKTLGVGGALGTSFIIGKQLGVSKAQSVDPQIPIKYGSFASDSSYVIFPSADGSTINAKNGITGAIDFSASSTDASTVFQAVINALATLGTSVYARGGTVTIFPADYNCLTPWTLPTGTAHSFQATFQGSGKSNTTICFKPTGKVPSAITTGYTGWIGGEYGPKLTFKDLSLLIGGNYTGTSGISGTYSIVDLEYYDVFLEDMQLSVNATLQGTNPVTAICVGGYAGPSEPVTWKHVEIDGALASGSTYPFQALLWEWYEGFSWRGGKVEMDGSNPSGYSNAFTSGLAFYGNGPTVIEGISNYGTADIGSYIYLNGSDIVLDNLGYPATANVGSHITGGYSAQVVTIIHTQQAAAVNAGMHLKGTIAGDILSLKTIGFSFGKQSTPFYVQSGGQYHIGINIALEGVATPIASTDYMANTDFLINCSGGTGVSISILDDFGNTIASGLKALGTGIAGNAPYRMSQGMHINFGAFTAAPTVSVYQVSG